MKKNVKILLAELAIILIIVAAIIATNIIGVQKVAVKNTDISEKTFDDVDKPNIRIGCLIGTTVGDYLGMKFKNAEIKYYNTNENVYVAVDTGAVDFGVGYIDTYKKVCSEYDNIKYINEPAHITNNSFAFPKTEKGKMLCDKFNTFVEKYKKSGRYDELEKKWRSLDSENYHLESYNLSGENGKINVCINAVWEPMAFIHNGDYVGFYPELVMAFCEEYGYIPQFESAEYAAELAGLTTGKYDMMADIVEMTSERSQVVYLSTGIYENIEILYSHEPSTDTIEMPKYKIFIETIKKGIYRNFILDNRWQMFVHGLIITISLAVLSAIFGTILGSIICFMRMNNNAFLTAFARIYIKIIQGTPIVVLLMVLNYIVFKNKGLSAFVVSTIGFTIDFSAYVSEIFRSGIEAVPSGQSKAAYALGFDKFQTFFKIVLPQALIHIIPVYSGQFISMVKLTSVAGYISVEDLTKISDYVRSLTYEAFFPLISTAIIYFLLATILISVLKIIEKKIDPKLRKRNIKGVRECLSK